MNIPIWVRSIFLIGIPIIVAIIVQFAFIPRISKRIDKAYEDLEAEGRRCNINELEIKMPNCFSIFKKKKEVSTSNQSNDKGTNDLTFIDDFREIRKKYNLDEERVISSRIVRYDGTSINIHDERAKIIKNDPPEIFHIFAFLQTLTAIFTSFAHGGNDVSNSIGPLVTIWITWSQGVVTDKVETPIWILGFGGVGISVGLWLLGWRVMRTIGKNLTKITPSVGFVIEFSAALTVLAASKLGLPVSTTHCQVGAVIFTGILRNKKNVNLKLFRRIGLAWIATVPIGGILSGFIFWGIKKILKV
ncbi:hypothetical protein SNEBB_002753 [Seison nebaliae]|nr:hypothetical protein SNEBB_002753 [Seison nebaliae]